MFDAFLDFPTSQVRSIFLRGFDQDMANRVGEFMETEGVKFVRQCVPTKIEKVEDPTEGEPGLYKVYGKYNNGDEFCEEYNTSESQVEVVAS